MNLIDIAKKVFVPEMDINHEDKTVLIKGENFFGEVITEEYYKFKGYKVEREYG